MVPVESLAPFFPVASMAVKSLWQRETAGLVANSVFTGLLLVIVPGIILGSLEYRCRHVVSFVDTVLQSNSCTGGITTQERLVTVMFIQQRKEGLDL